MRKGMTKSSYVLAILCLVVLLAPAGQTETKGKPPTITFSYAQEKIRQGEIWRIYIAVEDPDGDMSKIVCTIEQTGGYGYRPSITQLKKGMERKFAGHLALYSNSHSSFWGMRLQLTLTVLDRAGNESETVVFPLEFNGEPMKPLPSDMANDLNQRIGNVTIDLFRREGAS